ncbi:hypothetical protein PHOSAC3_120080 [Mesotoga infera]|nr:hypothetical protein PHOSAC3_120080 [Mesotoga infera]
MRIVLVTVTGEKQFKAHLRKNTRHATFLLATLVPSIRSQT